MERNYEYLDTKIELKALLKAELCKEVGVNEMSIDLATLFALYKDFREIDANQIFGNYTKYE